MPNHIMDAPDFFLKPKDFIETPEGLIFAVLSHISECGRIPAYLRYRRTAAGLQKVATQESADILNPHGERFYFESSSRAIRLQGVPLGEIHRIFRAHERAEAILTEMPKDRVLAAAQKLLRFMRDEGISPETIGVTGSLLIGAQTAQSDIDLVAYDREGFHRLRARLLEGIRLGVLEDLSMEDWSEAHARRGSALTLEEYLHHERRKANKGMVDGIKFDLSLVDVAQAEPEPAQTKGCTMDLRATVTDAQDAFGFPARYGIDHPTISEVLAFSQTYAGQARIGERIWVRGRLERLRNGGQRLVVGLDREAQGEFIKREEEPRS